MTFVLVGGKSIFTVTGEAAATGVAVSGGVAESILVGNIPGELFGLGGRWAKAWKLTDVLTS